MDVFLIYFWILFPEETLPKSFIIQDAIVTFPCIPTSRIHNSIWISIVKMLNWFRHSASSASHCSTTCLICPLDRNNSEQLLQIPPPDWDWLSLFFWRLLNITYLVIPTIRLRIELRKKKILLYLQKSNCHCHTTIVLSYEHLLPCECTTTEVLKVQFTCTSSWCKRYVFELSLSYTTLIQYYYYYFN